MKCEYATCSKQFVDTEIGLAEMMFHTIIVHGGNLNENNSNMSYQLTTQPPKAQGYSKTEDLR